MNDVAVVGGGPAGLSAAEVMAMAGLQVTIYEAKPSLGRKFLMAGKSGLNLTHLDRVDQMLPQFAEAAPWLAPALRAWDSSAIIAWAEELGQPMFSGSTGRVFPRAMKASPLLRAWLARLADLGVRVQTRHRWVDMDRNRLVIETAAGRHVLSDASAVVLACGGASWSRLGSDGAWAGFLGIPTAPFTPANVGLRLDWTDHMTVHLGRPIKGVAWHAGPYRSRGEAVIASAGLEGGGIYAVSRGVREGADLTLDLLPDLSVDDVAARLDRPRGKTSFSNHLRKVLRLDPVKIALAQEWGRPWPGETIKIARRLKKLRVPCSGLAPMDGAISTAGGVPAAALTPDLMLHAMPGVFCAGEMLDWEAPTGGYLLTACLATGRWAGHGVVRRLTA